MSVITEYRKTLAALQELEEKKRAAGADPRQLDLLTEEMDEVAEVICHLEKGEKRYRWENC